MREPDYYRNVYTGRRAVPAFGIEEGRQYVGSVYREHKTARLAGKSFGALYRLRIYLKPSPLPPDPNTGS